MKLHHHSVPFYSLLGSERVTLNHEHLQVSSLGERTPNSTVVSLLSSAFAWESTLSCDVTALWPPSPCGCLPAVGADPPGWVGTWVGKE